MSMDIMHDAAYLVQQSLGLHYCMFLVGMTSANYGLTKDLYAQLTMRLADLKHRVRYIKKEDTLIKGIVEKAIVISDYTLDIDKLNSKITPPFTPEDVAYFFESDNFNCFPEYSVSGAAFARMYISHLHNIMGNVTLASYDFTKGSGVFLIPEYSKTLDNMSYIYLRNVCAGEYEYDEAGYQTTLNGLAAVLGPNKSSSFPRTTLLLSNLANTPGDTKYTLYRILDIITQLAMFAQSLGLVGLPGISMHQTELAPLFSLLLEEQLPCFKRNPIRDRLYFPLAHIDPYQKYTYVDSTYLILSYLITIKQYPLDNQPLLRSLLNRLSAPKGLSVNEIIQAIKDPSTMAMENYREITQHPVYHILTNTPTLLAKDNIATFLMEEDSEDDPVADDPASDDAGGDDELGGDDFGGDDLGGDDLGGDDFGGDDFGGDMGGDDFGGGGFGDEESEEDEPEEEHLFNLGPVPELDSILYRLELERKINLILENPPKKADPGVLKILAKLRNYWLHIVDFKSLQILIKAYSKGALT
jgi:hypothetical protein